MGWCRDLEGKPPISVPTRVCPCSALLLQQLPLPQLSPLTMRGQPAVPSLSQDVPQLWGEALPPSPPPFGDPPASPPYQRGCATVKRRCRRMLWLIRIFLKKTGEPRGDVGGEAPGEQ